MGRNGNGRMGCVGSLRGQPELLQLMTDDHHYILCGFVPIIPSFHFFVRMFGAKGKEKTEHDGRKHQGSKEGRKKLNFPPSCCLYFFTSFSHLFPHGLIGKGREEQTTIGRGFCSFLSMSCLLFFCPWKDNSFPSIFPPPDLLDSS